MKLGGEYNIHSLRITPTQVFVSDVEIGGIAALKYEEEVGSLGKLTLVLFVNSENVDIQLPLPDFDTSSSEISRSEEI